MGNKNLQEYPVIDDEQIYNELLEKKIVPSNVLLTNACIKGQVDVVSFIINSKTIDISFLKDEALIAATINNKIGIIKLLLDNCPTVNPNNAIEIACSNKFKTVDILLKDIRTIPNEKCIINAIKNNNIAILESILTHKQLSTTNTTKKFLTKTVLQNNNKIYDLIFKHLECSKEDIHQAFILAITRNNEYIINSLITQITPTTKVQAINTAISYQSNNLAKFLLEDDILDLSANENNILHSAIINNNFEMVKLLLAHKSIIPNINAIITAINHDKINIFKLLLSDKRIDLNDSNAEALKLIVKENRIEMFICIIASKKVDPSIQHNMFLRFAIKIGNYQIAKELLDDYRVKIDKTIIIYAIDINREEMLTLLLRYIIDYSDLNKAFELAVKSNKLKLVEAFFENSVIDHITIDTLLIRYVIETNDIDMLKILLKQRAYTDVVYEELRFAIKLGNLPIVKMYVDLGFINNRCDDIIINVANNNDHKMMAYLLESKIVDPKYNNHEAAKIALRNNYDILLDIFCEYTC